MSDVLTGRSTFILDQLFKSIRDEQKTLIANVANVPGAEPSILVNAFFRRFFVI